MSKLDKLREQRNRGTAQPFLELQFRGIADVFTVEETPLTIRLNPPSLTYIISSGYITTNILRHSDTYQNKIVNKQVPEGEKVGVVQDAVSELANKMLATPEAQMEQIAIIVGIGQHYLMEMAVDCYYDKDDEKVPVKIVEKLSEVEAAKVQFPDAEVFHIGEFAENEFFECAMELISAVPTKHIANINFGSESEIKSLTLEGQESEATGVMSIPADRTAKFPRNLRRVAMENVSAPSGNEA